MEKETSITSRELVSIVLLAFAFIFLVSFTFAAPVPPDSLVQLSNTTKNISGSGYILNTSGGYITTINLTSSTQNRKWKGFVGYITGKFTLDDASGSTLYDWTLTSTSGEVYATRNSSTISWTAIQCANVTTLNAEDVAMAHTNFQDNITKTFNAPSTGTHPEFFVGTVNISVNSCPALHTFVNDTAQSTRFAEVALYTPGTVLYSTILESRYSGFDNSTYDFQMIVPENGAQSFAGSTAYYLYVELT